MEALRGVITPERIAGIVEKTRKAVDPFAESLPDSIYLKATLDQRDEILKNLPGDAEKAYQYYLDSLENPMPFFLGNAETENGMLSLSWDAAYDFDGEFVRYDVQVSSDWDFAQVLFEKTGTLETRAELPVPEEGEYFWRVTAKNESGRKQVAFDSIVTASGAHHGMRRFVITGDGEAVNEE